MPPYNQNVMVIRTRGVPTRCAPWCPTDAQVAAVSMITKKRGILDKGRADLSQRVASPSDLR